MSGMICECVSPTYQCVVQVRKLELVVVAGDEHALSGCFIHLLRLHCATFGFIAISKLSCMFTVQHSREQRHCLVVNFKLWIRFTYAQHLETQPNCLILAFCIFDPWVCCLFPLFIAASAAIRRVCGTLAGNVAFWVVVHFCESNSSLHKSFTTELMNTCQRLSKECQGKDGCDLV